ncbi:MAG: nickel pincer cofactor biosynthesis protein LarC [Nitrospira sp.]|nr:nickel pincer cofactor biosynthesis protein LarC [Candidatus Manganitrophaceae bacterium]HIL34014.1 nickel pincer cofactor biosynthesis protein LarC [Candidatus Manganitrophaceae bacterium]
MNVAYFDCFSGISGDMILGALVDAGVKIGDLQDTVDKLDLPGCTLKKRRVRRVGLAGTKIDVLNPKKLSPFQTFSQIEQHLLKSRLSKAMQKGALEIFRRLAQAEASAHGKRSANTRLHEVGDIDTLVDVVGALTGLSLLRVDQVYASAIHVGTGIKKTSGHTFPLPAPATAYLLKGIPVYATGIAGELTTPTGAAIITTLASGFVPLPLMTVKKIGVGAGSHYYEHPNLLRLFVGSREEVFDKDEVVRIETNIDDMNPQIYEHVFETLFEAGALDVFLTPIIMKKGRPAILITVLSPSAQSDKMVKILFDETTTLGVRIEKVARKTLRREIKKENTRHGPVHIKTAFRNGKAARRRPEFREAKRLAVKKGRPLRSILEEINRDLQ